VIKYSSLREKHNSGESGSSCI